MVKDEEKKAASCPHCEELTKELQKKKEEYDNLYKTLGETVRTLMLYKEKYEKMLALAVSVQDHLNEELGLPKPP